MYLQKRSRMLFLDFRESIYRKGCEFMDIAALSMAMAQDRLGTQIGVAVLDKSMDTAESTGAQLVQMIDSAAMQRSVNPHIGGNIDISV